MSHIMPAVILPRYNRSYGVKRLETYMEAFETLVVVVIALALSGYVIAGLGSVVLHLIWGV